MAHIRPADSLKPFSAVLRSTPTRPATNTMALSTRLLLLALGCALLNACLAALPQELRVNAADNAPGFLREMTNAERLAMGLPPKKPQFYRRGDKRGKPSALPKPDGPTSTSTARVAPVASATPAPSVNMATKCSPVTGTIKVASDDGSLDGFLGSPNEEGLYGFTADASAAVKFSYNPCDSTPFDITGEAVKSEGKTYELVGGVQDPRTGCFLVGDVPKTDAHATAQSLANPLADVLGLSSSQVASAIWGINGQALSAHLLEVGSAVSPAAPITYSTSTGLFALNGSGSCPGVNTTLTFIPA